MGDLKIKAKYEKNARDKNRKSAKVTTKTDFNKKHLFATFITQTHTHTTQPASNSFFFGLFLFLFEFSVHFRRFVFFLLGFLEFFHYSHIHSRTFEYIYTDDTLSNYDDVTTTIRIHDDDEFLIFSFALLHFHMVRRRFFISVFNILSLAFN